MTQWSKADLSCWVFHIAFTRVGCLRHKPANRHSVGFPSRLPSLPRSPLTPSERKETCTLPQVPSVSGREGDGCFVSLYLEDQLPPKATSCQVPGGQPVLLLAQLVFFFCLLVLLMFSRGPPNKKKPSLWLPYPGLVESFPGSAHVSHVAPGGHAAELPLPSLCHGVRLHGSPARGCDVPRRAQPERSGKTPKFGGSPPKRLAGYPNLLSPSNKTCW